MESNMHIYIVFGDMRCSDGDNIAGVFATKEAAYEYKMKLERIDRCTTYSVESFEVSEEG